jgi:hypothetical protein
MHFAATAGVMQLPSTSASLTPLIEPNHAAIAIAGPSPTPPARGALTIDLGLVGLARLHAHQRNHLVATSDPDGLLRVIPHLRVAAP